jgi:hypothetical protein
MDEKRFILWLDYGLEGWSDYRYATFAVAEEAAKDTWWARRWAITELLKSSDDDPALESSRP